MIMGMFSSVCTKFSFYLGRWNQILAPLNCKIMLNSMDTADANQMSLNSESESCSRDTFIGNLMPGTLSTDEE